MPSYHVISNGIADGQAADRVRSQLAALFKTSEDKVEPLLSQHKLLKKTPSADNAQRYHAAFEKAGLDCYVQAIDAEREEEDEFVGLDSSWEALVECPKCGFHQPLLEKCQNCEAQLHKLDELGELDTEWETLVACEQCHFMQPPTKVCRNCGAVV